MSPSVERAEIKVGDKPEQGLQLIVIRLNDQEVFDTKKFDELVRGSMEPTLEGWSLKYIVCADTMYIFPGNTRHRDALSVVKAGVIAGELQSAGYVWFFKEPGSPKTIDGYSTTLLGRLSQADSEAYKNTVIKEALGDFFQFK